MIFYIYDTGRVTKDTSLLNGVRNMLRLIMKSESN